MSPSPSRSATSLRRGRTSSGTQSTAHCGGRLYIFVAVELVRGRVLLPIRTWFRHRMLVDRVVIESPGVVSVWVRGPRLNALGAEAGQFLLWRFLAPGHVWSAHPYSLSAAPDHGRLRITVKEAGDHSAALAHLRPGTPVIAEGPFGALHPGQERELPVVADRRGFRHRTHPGARRGARAARAAPPPRCDSALPGRACPDLALRAELDHLAQRSGPAGGLPGRAPLGAGQRSTLCCGAPRARPRRAVAGHLRVRPGGHDAQRPARVMRELRVPVRQLHSEDFEMA